MDHPLDGVLLSAFVIAALLAYGWLTTRAVSARGRVRCIAPPVVWLQLRRDGESQVVIRTQLTCYLHSRRSDPAWVRHVEARLHIHSGDFDVPWTSVGDADGNQYPVAAGYQLVQESMLHGLLEFASNEGDVVEELRMPGTAVRMVLWGLVDNDSRHRKLATVEFVTADHLRIDGGWSKTQLS